MELLAEFATFVVHCLFWYFIISIVVGFLQRRREDQEQTFKEQYERLNTYIHRVQVEKHGEVFYWFDADDDEFLGQGKDTDEAVSQIKKRFPKHIFFLADSKQSYKLSGPDWTLQPLKLNESKT